MVLPAQLATSSLLSRLFHLTWSSLSQVASSVHFQLGSLLYNLLRLSLLVLLWHKARQGAAILPLRPQVIKSSLYPNLYADRDSELEALLDTRSEVSYEDLQEAPSGSEADQADWEHLHPEDQSYMKWSFILDHEYVCPSYQDSLCTSRSSAHQESLCHHVTMTGSAQSLSK